VALAGKPHRSLTVAQPYLNDPSRALTKKVRNTVPDATLSKSAKGENDDVT